MTYGGTLLTDDEAKLVLDKAATEMAQLRQGNTDCGVVIKTISVANDPEPDASTRLGWLPTERTMQWPQRVTNVQMATNACHSYYDCLGVAVFSLQPAETHPVTGEELFVVRYMDRHAPVRDNLHDVDGTYASGGLWQSTHLVQRTVGYACPSDHVDASWYYNAWQARLADIFPQGGDIPLSALGATEHFKTIGHLWRLWPNEHCKLTPVLLTPESGCQVLRCPTHTICPAGYRVKHATNQWCTVGAGPEQTVTNAAIPYTASYLNANNGAYVTPPCNHPGGTSLVNDVGGECGYDLSVLDTGNTAAVCACNANVPEGDEACQFIASQHCRGFRESTTSNCNGEGTCALDMGAVQWTDDSLGLTPVTTQAEYTQRVADGRPPPIQCACDNEESVLAPWCDRSVCSYTVPGGNEEIDCHTDPVDTGSLSTRSGTCLRHADGFKCVCNDLYFGDHCEYHDVFDAPEHTESGNYVCFLEAIEVGVSIPERLYLECSGHGTCVPPPIGRDTTLDNIRCECASSAYNGTWCQEAACPDCGPYGKCILFGPDETESGEYETHCVCAVHENSPATPLAAKPQGSGIDGPCSVDLCLDVAQGRYGSLVLNEASVMGGGDAPPTGRCTCTVTGNGLRNEGLFCDQPVCDRDANGHECGIPLEAVKDAVCRSCADHPDLLGCAGSVLPVGGVCDCDNQAGDDVPYWETQQAIDRYTHDGARGSVAALPVCSIYCRYGAWREENGVHACQGCFQDGYVGDRCDEAICVHGEYDAAVSALCVPGSCEPGWAGARCDRCDPGFGLDDTLGQDANPGCDVCLAGWAHPLGLEPAVVAALPNNATCLPCASVPYCHAPGTATQACAHDFAPVKFTCECADGWQGQRCDQCRDGYARAQAGGNCVAIDTLVSCGTGATRTVVVFRGDGLDQVLDTDASHCLCRAHFDEATACQACVQGYAFDQDQACVPCMQALQCHAKGTQAVACPVPGAPGAPDTPGACHCFPGYAGTTCDACDAGATWDAQAQVCTPCSMSCGPNGVPDCGADPPVCMCFNGYSGEHCGACTECGPGGTCVDGAFLATPWCTCNPATGWEKSVTPNTPGATDAEVRQAPCDICKDGHIAVDATGLWCRPVVDVCGYGAHVDASYNAGGCICRPEFLPLSQQPTGTCVACAGNGVGPLCELCEPPCEGNSHCAWHNTTLRVGPACACDTGFVDSLLGPCSQCDAPAYQGAFCRPCPGECGLGTCVVEPASQDTFCQCPEGTLHAVPTDPSSMCIRCREGETPLSCRPCPVCGDNSVCSEDEGGDPVCVCIPGHTRAPWASRPADPCFLDSDLQAFLQDPVYLDYDTPVEPQPATDLPTQLSALPANKRIFIYLGFPLFALSMCACGGLVWSLRGALRKDRAAARRTQT